MTVNPIDVVRQYYKFPFEPRRDQIEDVNYLCGCRRGGGYLPVGAAGEQRDPCRFWSESAVAIGVALR